MASSSPYQNNDYQAVSAFRPYRLPVNDIFKGLVAQDQFWKEGAQRVKGVYDNALNLQLTNEDNRKIRDDYVKEAEQQITKLSSMDLTDPSVQRQGINLFKPLFQDRGIVSDDAATKAIQKINSDALSYKTRDGGKGYSVTNHQYALFGSKEFKESKDRFAGEEYLKNRKEYEPFYDPTSELSGILKNCKPSKATNDAVKGMYIETYSNESLTSAKINTCLDAGLSDRARRQLEINGTVTYKNNPEALRDKYVPHLQGTRTQMSEQKAAIEGILANKDNLKNLKPEQLAKLGIKDASEITPNLLQSLEEAKKGLDTRMENTTRTIQDLQNNKFDAISGENLERVASVVYSRDYMQNVAEGFSYDFSTNTVKADAVQMMYYREGQTNARQEDDQSFDRETMTAKFDQELKLEKIKAAKGDGTSGSILDQLNADGSPANPLDPYRQMPSAKDNDPFSTIAKNDTYDQVVQERHKIAAKRGDTNQWLYTQLTGMGMDKNYKPGTPEFDRYRASFRLGASNDPMKKQIMMEYDQTMDNLVALEDIHRNAQQKVDAKIAPLEAKMTASLQAVEPVSFNLNGKNITLTGKDIYGALTGGASPLKIVRGSSGIEGSHPGAHGIGPEPVGANYKPDQYYYNGVLIPTTYGKEGNDLTHAVRRMYVDHTKNIQTIKAERNSAMQKETVIQREAYSLPELNDPKGKFKLNLAQNAAINLKDIDKLSVQYTDLDGHIKMTVLPADKNQTDYDPAAVKKALISTYNGRELDDGSLVLSIPDPRLDQIHENDISSVMTKYIRTLEDKTQNPNEPATTGFMRSGDGHRYRLDVTTGLGGGYSYKIFVDSQPGSPVAIHNTRESALEGFKFVLKRYKPEVPTK
jgi:hypothetical protein